MEKNLIKRLLQICQSAEECWPKSASLSGFVRDYNLGYSRGARFCFSAKHKAEIRALLQQTEGIDASQTRPEQWDGLSRTQSLALGSNEKLSSRAVRANRVAVKALAEQALLLGREPLRLPVGSNLDMDATWLAAHCQHDSVLVIENWEAFAAVHQVNFPLNAAGDNPLVVFRGSPVYSQGHVISLLETLQLPVFAFADFDPAGLVLAQSLPGFSGLATPPLATLKAALAVCTNQQRYQAQLPQVQQALESSTHPEIRALWQLLQEYGVALPQEYFLNP